MKINIPYSRRLAASGWVETMSYQTSCPLSVSSQCPSKQLFRCHLFMQYKSCCQDYPCSRDSSLLHSWDVSWLGTFGLSFHIWQSTTHVNVACVTLTAKSQPKEPYNFSLRVSKQSQSAAFSHHWTSPSKTTLFIVGADLILFLYIDLLQQWKAIFGLVRKSCPFDYINPKIIWNLSCCKGAGGEWATFFFFGKGNKCVSFFWGGQHFVYWGEDKNKLRALLGHWKLYLRCFFKFR